MPDLKQEISALLAEQAYRPDEPGCAVGVYLNGEPLFEGCHGVRALGGTEPITPTTNFRIASVSKQFTAAAILLLAERGQLRLAASLCDLFPGFPAYGAEITVAELIGHTSGIKDYEDLIPSDFSGTFRDADVLHLMTQQESGDFAPGSAYHYSNTAYALLALIVEKITCESFPSFLEHNLFGPAGMKRSLAWDDRIAVVDERAMGHRRDKAGAWELRDQGLTTSVLGDGGIYTSIREYALWDLALRNDRILSPAALRQAYTPGRLDDGSSTGYGFGWRIEEKRGLMVCHHTGSTTGFNSFARRIPSIGLCTIFLANRNGDEPKNLAPKIEDLALAQLKDLLP
ncbi:serine hydrolase [bacterium]|nr:serine hydrolase [bacterium]